MHYIKKLSVVAFLVVLFACGDKDRIPGNIMKQEEMSAVLADLTIAEAYGNNLVMNNNPGSYDSLRQEKIKVYSKQVLDLHQVSVKDFYNSYTWYEQHPDKLTAVLNQVTANLTERKNKAPDMGELSAPVAYRLRTIFPNAEKAILLSANSDTTKPFIKRQK
ncbi:DUF4296 domain-containing protein [Chitinophaga sp. sic0106]|uniref:DUF4296 domain-containing protein n=1 Tax=Chitinophaga sp. sic0106 TaxID=2854785 RepID=UPI001C477A3D|nr:DUF4296 domain-containing protein [Chitinophaga sp. sic0106]MBV7533283.1 DUF4296 domain-containing protein [Chitinophaga sp. sic0106]